MAQNIDVFENPFLGMEGKIKKTLGESEEHAHTKVVQAGTDTEQQMFESFVKEKTTLLSYMHDMIRFAAKLQDIDLSTNNIIDAESPEEEKKEDELRIKSEKDCAIIANRINGVVSVFLSSRQVSKTRSFFVVGSLKNTKNSLACSTLC